MLAKVSHINLRQIDVLIKKYVLILSVCATIINGGMIYFFIAHYNGDDMEIVFESESDADYGEEEIEQAFDREDNNLMLESELAISLIIDEFSISSSQNIFINVVTPPPERYS